MNYRLNYFIILSILPIVISCGKKSTYNYHKVENIDRQVIISNKVKKITESKIMYDSTETSVWKRIESIKYYNNNGVCTTKISPRYNLKSGEDFFPIETYDYLGFSDTAIYKYDNELHLTDIFEILYDISGRRFIKKTERVFDKNGNQISYCRGLEDAELKCTYSEYQYGNKGQIVSQKDIIGDVIDKTVTILNYKYDANNNLISDGKWDYKINEKGKVAERIPLADNYLGTIIEYDNNGRISQETNTYIMNPKTHTIGISKETSYLKHNAENLLIERKYLSSGRMKYLLKYDYEK